jgi:transcriptional regulator with XRE-family HTH domain
MSTLESQLGIDLSSPSQRRAILLAENDAYMLRDLIELRDRLGLKQKDVAELLGVSQASVSAFESHDNDPKLSTIRRYAHAIGAIISHSVDQDLGTVAIEDGTIAVDEWDYAGCSVTRGRFRSQLTQRVPVYAGSDWESSPVSA